MAERLRRLARLAGALGDAVTLDDIARAALHEVLEIEGVIRGGLALSEGGGRELRFVASDPEALSPLGVRWCTIDAYDDVPVAHAARRGEVVHLPDLDAVARHYPDLLERQLRIGARALTAVPLMADGTCVGGLVLSWDHELTPGPEQQAFLAAFVAQLAQAVKRGLAYQVQHTVSEQLQRSLMPHSLPELGGLSIGAHYQPGGLDVDVGGDWYDVLDRDDGSVVLTLGDVMGKGVPAAIVMSEIRAATRAYALLEPDPATVLSRLDALVAHLPAEDQVVTMLVGLVDAERTTFTYAVAGHPPPLLISPTGRPTVMDDESGPALGVGIAGWQNRQVSLRDGMTVLAYSDGLVESRRQDLSTGIDRLRDVVAQLAPRRRNPRELCARLSELMQARNAAEDDVTIFAVTAAPDQTRATSRLPADAGAARLARAFVGSCLEEWGVDEEVIGTAALCTSELVTNAVIHSGTTSSVTVQADREYVLVLVQDRGGRGAVRRPEQLDPESVSGRGLTLVDALASSWAAEHSTDGTTVWFELALARDGVRDRQAAQPAASLT